MFKKENREYFQSIGLGRANTYYRYDSFSQIVKKLVFEQDKGLLYMYLVIDQDGTIVGRMNLTDIIQEPLNKDELGYRIGERHQVKGYATSAVKLILEQASQRYQFHRIEAGTASTNIGSQIVLIKNGFQFVEKYNQYLLQDNKWIDNLLFEKVID